MAGESPVFIAGVDFDPGDPDEVEVVRFAGAISRAERMEELREENARLRSLLNEQEEATEW